jgi:hypothetical protein
MITFFKEAPNPRPHGASRATFALKEKKPMIHDCSYDVIETISIISKSLARYETYMKDCQVHQKCQKIWTKIKSNREEELKMLIEELNSLAEKGDLKFEEQKAAA